MSGVNISMQVLTGGQSAKIAVSTSSVQSAALTSTSYLVTPDIDMFVRTGSNPTAVSTGADQILLAGSTYRIVPLVIGNLLAFISNGSTGSVYLTPDA